MLPRVIHACNSPTVPMPPFKNDSEFLSDRRTELSTIPPVNRQIRTVSTAFTITCRQVDPFKGHVRALERLRRFHVEADAASWGRAPSVGCLRPP